MHAACARFRRRRRRPSRPPLFFPGRVPAKLTRSLARAWTSLCSPAWRRGPQARVGCSRRVRRRSVCRGATRDRRAPRDARARLSTLPEAPALPRPRADDDEIDAALTQDDDEDDDDDDDDGDEGEGAPQVGKKKNTKPAGALNWTKKGGVDQEDSECAAHVPAARRSV